MFVSVLGESGNICGFQGGNVFTFCSEGVGSGKIWKMNQDLSRPP